MAVYKSVFNSNTILNSIRNDTFNKIIKQLVPERIYSQNKDTIDTFSESLLKVSPISTNIDDIFYKGDEDGLKAIQEQFNYQFLNDFARVYKEAQLDPILKEKLSRLIDRYNEAIGGDYISVDNLGSEKFYGNEKEAFSEDRFLLGKSFHQEKGTRTGLEYAYRVAHDSKVEGPLRKNYFFQFSEGSYTNDTITAPLVGQAGNVAYPNGNPTAPAAINDLLPTDGSTTSVENPSVATSPEGNLDFKVGDFVVGVSTDPYITTTLPKFTYKVECSMVKPFWDHIVKPLAHPVGFFGEYSIRDYSEWVDYFSTTRPYYYADFISVEQISFDGVVQSDLYSTEDGLPRNGIAPITNSSLKHFSKGTIPEDDAKYPGWSYDRYEFSPTDFEGDVVRATLTYYTNSISQVVEFQGYDYVNEVDYRGFPKIYDKYTVSVNDDSMTGPFIVSDTSDEIVWEQDITGSGWTEGLASGSNWAFVRGQTLIVGDQVTVGQTKTADGPDGVKEYFNIVGGPVGESQLYKGDRSTDYISDEDFEIVVLEA